MIVQVVCFFISICAASAALSVPLLALNNNYVLCFSMLLCTACTCWLFVDNMTLAADARELSKHKVALELFRDSMVNLQAKYLELQREHKLLKTRILQQASPAHSSSNSGSAQSSPMLMSKPHFKRSCPSLVLHLRPRGRTLGSRSNDF